VTPQAAGPRWQAPLARLLAALYLALAGAVSVWLAAQMPSQGPLLDPFLPSDCLMVLRVKDGDRIWRALESDPGVRGIWTDDEFQRLTGLAEKLRRGREDWGRRPAPVRWFVSPDRAGLHLVLGGESALALLSPEEPPDAAAGRREPAVLLLTRLQGARGGLLRIAARLAAGRKRAGPWRDLGGGLVAIGLRGAQPASAASSPAGSTVPADAMAEICIYPQAIAAARHVTWTELFEATPSLSELLTLPRPPDEVRICLRPLPDGGLAGEGRWLGPLPQPPAPAPLMAPRLPEGALPMLDLLAPLQPRGAFWRWLQDQMNASEKSRRRWESRLGRLAEANVDLERDLWPDFGRTLRLQVLPPPESAAAEQALVSFSLPFAARDASLRALAALAQVTGNGVFEGAPPPDVKRPYFVRVAKGDIQYFVSVRGAYMRPTWAVSGRALAFISDAGAEALTSGPPPLSAAPEAGPEGWPLFRLRADGSRLAPHFGALAQMELEDLRDELGAAEFLRRYPDEGATAALVEKLARLAGELEAELRAAAPGATASGSITIRWRPP
jgi:hypothetical protein